MKFRGLTDLALIALGLWFVWYLAMKYEQWMERPYHRDGKRTNERRNDG